MISFTLPIAPVAKGRPRFGNGRTFTPAKTRAFERDVARLARLAYRGAPLKGPVGVSLKFLVARPKSAPKRVTWPAVRPDLDNFYKATLDALNGIAFTDDGQVCVIYAKKEFGPPSIVVRVWALEDWILESNVTAQPGIQERGLET